MRPNYPTQEAFELEIISHLNNVAFGFGLAEEFMKYNGFNNSYVNVLCRFCEKYKL